MTRLDHRDSRLRVALPMTTLVPGEMGGSETYGRALTRHLGESTDLDVTVLLSRRAAGFSEGVPEYVVRHVSGGGSTSARIRTLAQSGMPGRSLRNQISAADVVHYPFSVPLPRARRGTPVVQTLHDVQHHDLPELFSRTERHYRAMFYDRAARRADTILTVSDFCKRRIVKQLSISPERVRVAHLGVDTDVYTPYTGRREPFVLYPARGWPHKNHRRLIEAIALVREHHPDLRLVLTGGDLAALGDLPAWVEPRGLVSHDELRDLYRRAACLAFPSLYEGFGLPPLEAMASGCPVAAASSGSLPEICGDAAVLFDPHDPAAIARGVSEALDRVRDLSARGIDRVHAFTWRACAAVHAEVYHAVAERRRREGGRVTAW